MISQAPGADARDAHRVRRAQRYDHRGGSRRQFVGPADFNHYNRNLILFIEYSNAQLISVQVLNEFVVTVALTVCWSYESLRIDTGVREQKHSLLWQPFDLRFWSRGSTPEQSTNRHGSSWRFPVATPRNDGACTMIICVHAHREFHEPGF